MGIKKELSYWQDHAETEQMHKWCGNHQAPFKVEARRMIRANKYKTVLDVGAGVFSEYHGFQTDDYDIEYSATEITPKYVEHGKALGINVVEASVCDLPFEDSSYDCVICYNVLNHIEDIESSVTELIRVASKEIFISFFKPFQKKYLENVKYHNTQGNSYRTTPAVTVEDRIVIEDETVCQFVYINQDFLHDILKKSKKVSGYKYFTAGDGTVLLLISIHNTDLKEDIICVTQKLE